MIKGKPNAMLDKICEMLHQRGYVDWYTLPIDSEYKNVKCYEIVELRKGEREVIIPLEYGEMQHVARMYNVKSPYPYIKIRVTSNETAEYFAADYGVYLYDLHVSPGKIYVSKQDNIEVSLTDTSIYPSYILCNTLEEAFAKANEQLEQFVEIAPIYDMAVKKMIKIKKAYAEDKQSIDDWHRGQLARLEREFNDREGKALLKYNDATSALLDYNYRMTEKV